MNRIEAKKLLPIITAFADGKTIQFNSGDDDAPKWVDVNVNQSISFELPYNTYRVKPEPKYRPFNNAEECWNEMLKHQPFGIVKDKDSLTFRSFTFLDGSSCNFIGYEEETFDEALKDLEFADGTPFGVKG